MFDILGRALKLQLHGAVPLVSDPSGEIIKLCRMGGTEAEADALDAAVKMVMHADDFHGIPSFF